MIGERLAHFHITAKLGEGGMGEVYRAEDTRLGREVAIKVLPETFVRDAERLARFEREAKVLASLNHPNIAGIYEVGHQPGEAESDSELHFLVMELAAGETLAERVRRGPIPLEEALEIALQIAEGLAAAHERGIVHRDLKPANVKVDAENRVKVLDFGLAKAVAPEHGEISGETLAASPTLTHQATLAGVLMGTAGYMSPEQARGRAVDKRADIWAFGVVVWEMLTGERLFDEPSVTDTIAAVVRAEPDWSRLPPTTPRPLRRLLRRCLAKDPRRRLHDVADARLELEASREAESDTGSTPTRRFARRELVAWGLAGVATILALAALLRTGTAPAQPVVRELPVRAVIPPPKGSGFSLLGDQAGPPVLSPDGRMLAFTAVGEDGQSRLWLRPLDALEARALPGTERAYFPFWSPDGRSIGFFAGSTLQRLDIDGGAPRKLADEAQGISNNCKGATWGLDGTILYSPAPQAPLFRIPASGGTPVQVTTRDPALHSTHRWPHFLPDGGKFLFLASQHQDLGLETSGIYLGSLDGDAPRQVLTAAFEGLYASGQLLTVEQGTLTARPFDVGEGRVTGPPVPTRESVQVDPTTWKTGFSASTNGMLVYASGGELVGHVMRWFTADGAMGPELMEAANLQRLTLSPDARRVAIELQNEMPTSDLWIYDLDRSSRLRLTFGAEDEGNPVWSVDGERLYFASRPGLDLYKVYTKPASGAGSAELLFETDEDAWPYDVSPDGRYLIYGSGPSLLGRGVGKAWAYPLEGGKAIPLLLDEGNNLSDLEFSPDGALLAYMSSVTGRNEVYLATFEPAAASGEAPRGKWQISTKGGSRPRWRADGRELYYLANDNALMAVSLEVRGGAPAILGERPLFRTLQSSDSAGFDVSPDGKRFLMNMLGGSATRPLRLVVDWPRDLVGR